MLSIVFPLAFSLVSAQTAINGPPVASFSEGCMAQIKLNTGLKSCGQTGNGILNGKIPTTSTDIGSDLQSLCSATCSAALKTLDKDLTSPACSEEGKFMLTQNINILPDSQKKCAGSSYTYQTDSVTATPAPTSPVYNSAEKLSALSVLAIAISMAL